MSPENQSGSTQVPPASAASAEPSPAAPGSSKSYWKWIFAVAAVALLAYPFLRPKSDPNTDANALIDKSVELYEAGQYEESLKAAQAALKLNPQSALAYNNIASALGKLGRWDEAITNVREALRLQPNFERAQNNLGWFKHNKDLGAPPIPQAAKDHIQASLTQYQAGNYQKSLEEAQAALKVKPDYALGFNNVAAAYNALGNWDEGIKAAQEALKIDPDMTIARNNLNFALDKKAKGAQK